MSLRVLWRNKQSATALRELDVPEEIDLRIETDRDKAARLGDWAEVLVDGNPSEELLDNPNLRHVVVPYAGLNEDLQRRAQARPRLSVHNSHYNSAMVAQHALALLLAVANRVVPSDRDLRRGRWNSPHDPRQLGMFLSGKKVLLLGYGAIAQAALPALRALGLEPTAFRQSPEPGQEPRQIGRGELAHELAGADVLLASLPLTPDTEGLLGPAEFALMKSTAILVNVGRGKVVDETALYEALAERRIFGAGIDVWYRYPEGQADRDDTRPSSLPFFELDNVVMTPHSADNLDGWQRTAVLDAFETLKAITAGRQRNLVDVSRGY